LISGSVFFPANPLHHIAGAELKSYRIANRTLRITVIVIKDEIVHESRVVAARALEGSRPGFDYLIFVLPDFISKYTEMIHFAFPLIVDLIDDELGVGVDENLPLPSLIFEEAEQKTDRTVFGVVLGGKFPTVTNNASAFGEQLIVFGIVDQPSTGANATGILGLTSAITVSDEVFVIFDFAFRVVRSHGRSKICTIDPLLLRVDFPLADHRKFPTK
jgi:hypothetical protein